jgi:drug/metabolite transporter (DMT)-like permease
MWLLLVVANILWAASYVAAKFALRETSVTIMLALRMCIAALALLPLLIIRRKELRLTRGELGQLALLSLVGFVINKLLEFGGLALTTASDVALLIISESLFTAALSWIVLRERFRMLTIVALLFGFVGVYLIVERGFIPNIPAGGGALRVFGDLLVVLALLIEAFYTVRGKTLLVKHSPLVITAASIVGSVIFWAPVAGWEVFVKGWHPISIIGWISIAWLAIMATALAYLAWFKGLSKIDGSAAAATLFIQPLLGTLLAITLLQDQLTPMTILGGILIVVSVSFISRQA